MDEKHLLETAGIDAEDWERTPVSVRQLVVQLSGKIEQLEQHLKELQRANEQKRGESQSQLKELP